MIELVKGAMRFARVVGPYGTKLAVVEEERTLCNVFTRTC